uniref:Zinc finger, GRF-type n=1 Tax=Tanacetum cinerariifolium TaxID=118510 RepID=A0A699H5S8_TANCI|nr:zinc finger, GRF-type [Tanacetum cinerariifolium]
MVRCTYGLEAVIRTSWTSRNPSRRLYGCPTLSLTCVNFFMWYDPPMCQRSVQIIPGLLRSRNEIEEILAMVEEKRRKLLANSDLLKDQLLVYFDLKTQRKVQLATKINNLARQLLDIIDERRSFIRELEQRLPKNVMAYKTRQKLKFHQKDDMIRVMKMRSTALQLHHQAMKGFHFYKSL